MESIRHFHWIVAGLFAVWVILLSLRIIIISKSPWVRVLGSAFLVNIALFALPQSFAVFLGGVIGYPIISWLMQRDFLPSFDLYSNAGILNMSCFLSALQVILIIAVAPGYSLYIIQNNSTYLIQLISLFTAITAVAVVIGRFYHLRWFITCAFSIMLIFVTNVYVVTFLLFPLLLGYMTGDAIATSPHIGLLVANAIVIALYYGFMSVFTLKGIGSFYPLADSPWILGTMLSPFLFGQGVLAWVATAK